MNDDTQWERELMAQLYVEYGDEWFELWDWNPGPFVQKDAIINKLLNADYLTEYNERYKFIKPFEL